MNIRDVIKKFFKIRGKRVFTLMRLLRIYLLRILGVNIHQQTEIQYLNQKVFQTKLVTSKKIENSVNIKLQQGEESIEHNFNSKYLVTLSNVLVDTEFGYVYAIHKSGRYFLISESTEWPTDRILLLAEKPPKKVRCNVEFGALGLPNSSFAHLMSEDLPNLLRIKSTKNIFFYEKSNLLNEQIFDSCGFNKNKVPKWVYASKLEMITKGKDVGYLHPQSLKLIRIFGNKISKKNSKVKTRKYYISRINYTRSSKKELGIQELFKKLNFEVIYPEKLSLVEQVKIFSNAELVAGIHGGGIFHSVWNKSCGVIELMPSSRINRCFEWQTILRDAKYRRLEIEGFIVKEKAIEDLILN